MSLKQELDRYKITNNDLSVYYHIPRERLLALFSEYSGQSSKPKDTNSTLPTAATPSADEWRRLFTESILVFFTPKCTRCSRRGTLQTVKGKSAQDHYQLPSNWGYYCKKHWDEGVEMENEALYG